MIHLPKGGSTAVRDIPCPGNTEKCKDIPPRPAGPAARDGSMKHEIMEICTRDNRVPADLLGHLYEEDGFKHVFGDGDDDLAQVEIAFAAQEVLLDKYDIQEFIVEPFVQYIPGLSGGSIDLLGLSGDGKTLLVDDKKFGQVAVSPIESAQHGVYTIAARVDKSTADMFKKVERIVFSINQPRSKGTVSVWETDLKWIDAFEKKYKKALDSNHIHPGKHCNWCPAAPYCEEKRVSVMATNLLGTKTRDELQASADMVEEVETWLKRAKEELYLQLTRGVAISGWKIIDKRATRRWRDEDNVAVELAGEMPVDLLYSRTLLTPPQMEKLLKKQKANFDLTDFIVSESSGTTLAPADHPSDAVLVSDVQGHLKDLMK
jgi:hypothetical protein